MPGIPSFVACRPGGPHIQQRDWLNLLAAFAAAKQCGVEVRRFARISSHLTTSIHIYIYITSTSASTSHLHLHCNPPPTPPQARLIAASPGVDAAAVAPEYERIRRGGATARVLEMDREGVLRELTDTAPPACTLPELPAALFPHRHDAALERRFCAELCTLDERIMADVPAEKRGEHASKTYHMLVCAAEAARSAPPGDGFFTLGQFRSAEKARAHLHSSYATGIYDLGHLAPA